MADTTDSGVAAEPRPLSPLGGWVRGQRSRPTMTQEERAAVVDDLFVDQSARAAYLWRFFVLLILSTLIATLGLVADSVAVIIGAMLLAPLMTPILAVAAALVIADARELVRSVAILVSGVAAAVATAGVATWVGLNDLTVVSELPAEIIGRTEPSLLDLGVAIAAGLAAGYVLTHRRVLSSLPGVAIAVALVPPLATVGITLELGQQDAARGALLLFATNLVAIVLSAIVMMRWAGFAPPELGVRGARSTQIGIAVSLVLLAAIAIPLTVHTRQVILDQSFAQTVGRSVQALDPASVIVELDAYVDGTDRATVSATLATTAPEPIPAWKLAEALAAETGRVIDVELYIDETSNDAATAG